MLSAPVLRRRHLFDRSNDQAVVGVGGAATEACRVTAATNEGLVRFQKAVQWTRPILAQPMAQLVCHGPGRLIRHIQFALQKLGRNPALVAAHQISGKKPLGQIGSCPVKHVPAVADSCRWQVAHSYTRGARLQPPRLGSAASGTANPPGQRSPAKCSIHCCSVPNCTTNSRSPAIDPPSDPLGYATLRRASGPEHFMNLSYP